MELLLQNEKQVNVYKYTESYLTEIQDLNRQEQWINLVAKKEETRQAWENSNIAYVVVENEKCIGYIRGFTDQSISLYICELLIDKDYRGLGVGKALLDYVHSLYPKTRMEMLASSTSRTYYNQLGFRPFYGFRKTYYE